MKTYEDCKKEVAQKHKLGNTLVTGHRAIYFQEAAELYAEQQVKNLNIPAVIKPVCPQCDGTGKHGNLPETECPYCNGTGQTVL